MRAIAVFQDKLNGNHIEFIQGEPINNVTVKGYIQGLPPGEHGFHIHEFGDLTVKECMGCGSHFNPYNKSHGGLRDFNSHAGDLGNITNGEIHFRTDKISLFPGKKCVIGRSVIIHSGRDDLGMSGDPTGLAGSRIDCAVIGFKA